MKPFQNCNLIGKCHMGKGRVEKKTQRHLGNYFYQSFFALNNAQTE
jgi:hypothetical protein